MVPTLSTRGTNSADSTLNAGSAINSFLKGSHMALMIIDCMHAFFLYFMDNFLHNLLIMKLSGKTFGKTNGKLLLQICFNFKNDPR